MGLAARMQKTATRLLGKFDESEGRIKLIRKGIPTWDNDAGEFLPSADTFIDLVGVTANYSESEINNTTVLSGDIMVVVTSKEQIKLNDKLLIDGVEWSVVSEPKANYTGIPICYMMQARK